MLADQISAHEVRIYETAKQYSGWLTAQEIAVIANVAPRTARHHAQRFVQLGLFDVEKTFGGFRYRIAINPARPGYVERLDAARRSITE